MDTFPSATLLSLVVHKFEDVVIARLRARQIATLLGFNTQDQTRIATAVSEIARNAVQYAGGGKVQYAIKQSANAISTYIVTISDTGSGIANAASYQQGASVQGGIGGAKRIVDLFELHSTPGKGSSICLTMFFSKQAPKITTQLLGSIADELIRQRPHQAFEELQQQNQELLHAMQLLRTSRDELEERVAERTQELMEVNWALQEEINERRDAKNSLFVMSERLNLALKAARMGTWVWDVTHKTHVWDAYMYPLFGVSKFYHLPPGFEHYFDFIHPNDQIFVNENLTAALEKESFFEIEFRVIWTDTTLHNLIVRGEVSRNQQGIAEKVIGVCWDITELKKTQMAFLAYQKKMAHINRTSSLGEMASALAHELNQPLTSISAFIRGCLRRLENDKIQPKILKEIMEEVAGQAERAGQILHRIKNGMRKGELFLEKVDLNAIIQNAIKLINYEMESYSVKIELQLAKNLPLVIADSIQIEQVIFNLLRNSLEAMKENSSENPTIIIQSQQMNRTTLSISVTDNGPGFPEESAEKVFEPYYTTKSQGMGMGLAICRTLVEAHGGHLAIKKMSMPGACFYFTLSLD